MKSSAEVAGTDLVAPLLKTKLEAPGCPRLVVRENLIEALSDGVSLPLTLVYGPAGSGKTMLVAQWRASAREQRAVAWLSLDADDDDPARFWVYVIEALRTVLPDFGEAALAMLRAPGIALVDGALPELINELVDVAGQSALVLDDYHAIEDERIHEGMEYLLEHLPNTLRIVITSRIEPPLGIGTLRARGQLNEIDAARLRFSASKPSLFSTRSTASGCPPSRWRRLHERTEGWGGPLPGRAVDARARRRQRVHRVFRRQRPTRG